MCIYGRVPTDGVGTARSVQRGFSKISIIPSSLDSWLLQSGGKLHCLDLRHGISLAVRVATVLQYEVECHCQHVEKEKEEATSDDRMY